MKITVFSAKEVRLGSGEGEINPKEGKAVITSWTPNDVPAVQAGHPYKLKAKGKDWNVTAHDPFTTLPCHFTINQLVSQATDADPEGVSYTLIFKNNSTNAGNIAVFQNDPDTSAPNVFPLAWFSSYTYPTTTEKFTWKIDYNFVWEETGELVPGVIFSASQNPAANLTTTNQITLVHDPLNDAYNFVDQGPGPRSGSLYIEQDKSVPLKQASVGIGMSGSGTYVVQAQPNYPLTFTPKPKYWVVFGTFTQGEVLDIQALTNTKEVDFPPGVYSMTVILNPDNTWTIAATKAVNSAIATARRNLPQLFGYRRAALSAAPETRQAAQALPEGAPTKSSNGSSQAAQDVLAPADL